LVPHSGTYEGAFNERFGARLRKTSSSWGGSVQRITRALAVAVPVVLSLPVAAQTVQIYGRL